MLEILRSMDDAVTNNNIQNTYCMVVSIIAYLSILIQNAKKFYKIRGIKKPIFKEWFIANNLMIIPCCFCFLYGKEKSFYILAVLNTISFMLAGCVQALTAENFDIETENKFDRSSKLRTTRFGFTVIAGTGAELILESFYTTLYLSLFYGVDSVMVSRMNMSIIVDNIVNNVIQSIEIIIQVING